MIKNDKNLGHLQGSARLGLKFPEIKVPLGRSAGKASMSRKGLAKRWKTGRTGQKHNGKNIWTLVGGWSTQLKNMFDI